MALIGAAIKGALGGYDKLFTAPDLPTLDPTQVQADTIAGNISNFDKMAELGAKWNTFSRNEFAKGREQLNPGFSALREKQLGVINSELSGNLPEDVADSLQRGSAARALGGGYGGSEMARNLTARDLGLASLQLTQQGLDHATKWISQSSSGPSFDYTTMMFTPQQRLGFESQQNKDQFQVRLLQNQLKAKADPFMAAIGDAFIQDESSITSMLGSAAGAAGGGGGGGGL